MTRGVIVKGVGGLYTVRCEDGQTLPLRAQSKLRRAHLTPMVGDTVQAQPGEGASNGWLLAIEPRRSALFRPPVANLDALAIVVSAGAPEADRALVDRLMLCARLGGVKPYLVISKCDEDEANACALAREYALAAPCYRVCAKTGEGVSALREALAGSLHAFGGQSGAGKSTLINALYGLKLETGELSEKIERGRHTTRHSELILLAGGGGVFDTPGFSLLELPLMEPEKLVPLVPELAGYEGKCRFSPCMHVSEPDCAAREAVERGEIPRARWERYCEAVKDMRERWRDRYG